MSGLDKLPGCMMPDGAPACAAYVELYDKYQLISTSQSNTDIPSQLIKDYEKALSAIRNVVTSSSDKVIKDFTISVIDSLRRDIEHRCDENIKRGNYES